MKGLDVMSWLGEAQWFVLGSVFIAALVTLAVYLGQYAFGTFWTRRRFLGSSAHGETDSLLSWILSLSSWRNQWLKAWIIALNDEASKRGGSLRLAFEENISNQPKELSVKQVTSVVKSANDKVVSCGVVGDSIQFTIRVTRTIPANSGTQIYNVCVTPLYINLELHMKENNGGNIQALWSMGNFADLNFQVTPQAKLETPGANAILETLEDILKNLMGHVRPSVYLSTRPTEGKDFQNVRGPGANSQVICPPKPPRAHELKLQVKDIRATLSSKADTSGICSAVCIAQLDEPAQKYTTATQTNTTNPSWGEEFTFELNAKSREILLHIYEAGKSADSNPPWAWAAVPLDLFRKQPSGRLNFPLRCGSGSATSGTITAQFLYIEPSDVKSWPIPAPVPAKKVEKDRTVMPCGTVVTTVTSVSSKPRVDGKNLGLSNDSPAKTPAKVKTIERDFSVQAIPSQSNVVSKTLSSSDTELLMLNGSDPVAEVAIRQLRESSRQSLKSPRKKSTIIISGISKSALSQDDEATLMFNYAASMDSSADDNLLPPDTTPTEVAADLSGASVQTLPAEDELHDAWEQDSQPGDWPSNGLGDKDSEELSIGSLSMSETGSLKKSKERSQAFFPATTPAERPWHESVPQ
ncbi:C2 domain-containing protein 2 isoform X2 [Bombina bombina]|uniref:C2 domain-containing protein 2 isoform X2 n=1 Tax=Bombina bombina TaxID=8345 RepID=UPI00235A8904|nr:C2 domain-containing protein 2 isoform X2 [Bombina bombina]